jgi:hypothetical protein
MGGAVRVKLLVGLACALMVAGCAAEKRPPAAPPQIPTIVAPTSATRTPVMADRPIPDDCEVIVPADQINAGLGQELPGEPVQIIGIPEPSLGRTGKIDCYYGIPAGKPLPDAMIIVGLATYADELTARNRVTDSLEAERKEGAVITDVEVGKQRGSLVATGGERLLIGSLGKTTFVVRAKNGVLPDDKIGPVLAGFGAQSMTQPIS